MARSKTRNRIRRSSTVLAVIALAAITAPGLAVADSHEGTAAAEIKKLILDNNAFTREKLKGVEGENSSKGSLEFWSSGGLLQSVPANLPADEFESFSITPKHIKVVELPGGEAAVAMYYSEGGMHRKGGNPVGHYMTRVMQVFVKEDGEWKVRAAHWSPVAAGAGTSQTAVN